MQSLVCSFHREYSHATHKEQQILIRTLIVNAGQVEVQNKRTADGTIESKRSFKVPFVAIPLPDGTEAKLCRLGVSKLYRMSSKTWAKHFKEIAETKTVGPKDDTQDIVHEVEEHGNMVRLGLD